MSTTTGVRAVWLAVAAVAVALLLAAAVLLATGGRADGGPPTGAADLVPADALGYVNVWIDQRQPSVRHAIALAARLPDFPVAASAVLRRLTAILGGGSQVDFSRDIKAWLGQEVALALINTSSSTAGSLMILDVRDRPAAIRFLRRAGATPDGSPTRYLFPNGAELAFARHYLLAGQPADVQQSLAVAGGRAASLQSDPGYRSSIAGAPADRVADLYLSGAGVIRVLGARHGVLAGLEPLLAAPALAGVAASLSPVVGGLRVRVHEGVDPTLARLQGRATPSFTPTLVGVVPVGTSLLYDVKGLDRELPGLLRAASAAGVAGRVGPLLQRLGGALAAEGVDVHAVARIFDAETAIAITPGSAPALTIVTRTSDPAQAQAQLAALELPLEQLFPAPDQGPGQAPLFSDQLVDGVTVHQLALGPGLKVGYTVYKGLVIVSTSLGGVASVIRHKHALDGDPIYRSALRGHPGGVRSLLFLDFSQLLSLGEQAGLLRSARYGALRPDLERIRAVGLYATGGETDTTVELFLQIP